MFFRAALLRFPANAAIRNQLAQALAYSGSSEKQNEAIRLAEETAEKNPTDQFSRMILARTLISHGVPDEVQRAIALLTAMTENEALDNKYARALLEQLKSDSAPEITVPDDDSTAGLILDETESSASQLKGIEPAPLAPQLSRLGRTRRLRSRLELDDGTQRSAALQELRDLLKEDPTFAYAQLLAVRQGIWVRNAEALPTFAAAFEMALQEEDKVSLERLAEQFPRFEALTLVARALFGDASSASRVAAILGTPKPWSIESVLRERIGSRFTVIEGGWAIAASEPQERQHILEALQDTNEWAVAGGSWRAAA